MKVLTLYELDAIGVNGADEAVAAFHFCSEGCRQDWQEDNPYIRVGASDEGELMDGEVCETCGKAFETPILKHNPTSRGFSRIDFTDQYGVACSLQKSSLAPEDCIWFGCNEADPKVLIPGEGWQPVKMPAEYNANTRMHLTQAQVAELIPYLVRFVETGDITS